MPRFLGLEVQTDVRCASGSRVAWFPAAALAACSAVLSPTEPESLTATLSRTDPRTAEVLVGRVVRTCFSDTTYDREWDVVELTDEATSDECTLLAHPIGLRLARKLYETTDAATGAPVFDVNIVGVTPADAIDDYVLPTLAARGMSWVSRGTVDPTARLDLIAEQVSALELVRLIAAPSAAEWQLRRNGDAGYYLDLLTAIGSSAGTLRIRTAHNLMAHRRQRSGLEAVTRVVPIGPSSGIERTIAAHLWRVAAIGTDGIGNYVQLADIAGGDGPIWRDGQLDGFYLASFASVAHADALLTDSRATTQRVYMASTAAFTVGQWARLQVGSGANGQRLTSLTDPLSAALPSAGGLGDLAEFLELAELRGDCNLVPNPWMRDWTTAGSPADGWTESAGTPANRTLTRETTVVREGSAYAQRVQTTGSTTWYLETPDIPFWAISGRRHCPALWFYVDACPAAATSAVVFDLYTAAGVKVGEIGRWVRGSAPVEDTWFRVEGAPMDLSALAGKVRIRATLTTTTGGAAASGWNVVFAHALLVEGDIVVSDIEYSGGTRLWQAANDRLTSVAGTVLGADLQVADLEADDPDTFGSLAIVPGQTVEVTDDVLGQVLSARLLELCPNYLDPLRSTVRVGAPHVTFVRRTAAAGGEGTPSSAGTPDSDIVGVESSFDEDGQLVVRVIGDADTASIFCAVSTAGDPTEATLMQATPTVGRQAEFTFTGPYDLGQAVYIAARGSTDAAGTGGLSTIIRARAIRPNSATSKTIRLNAAGLFQPYAPSSQTYSIADGYYAVGNSTQGNVASLPVPKGATLTAVRARVWCADTDWPVDCYMSLSVRRVDNDGAETTLGTDDLSSTNGAWETLTVGSLSESTAGDRSYKVGISTVQGSGFPLGSIASAFRIAWLEYDLDVPNVDVST